MVKGTFRKMFKKIIEFQGKKLWNCQSFLRFTRKLGYATIISHKQHFMVKKISIVENYLQV